MDTELLARHYDQLTPLERFPLIVAASVRQDEAERARLVRSAPRMTWEMPHHWGVARTFESLASFHFMKLLDLAAGYFLAFSAVGRRRKKDADALDGWQDAMYLGYEFVTYLAGWRQFCAELPVDPEIFWKLLPGYQTVKDAEELATGSTDRQVYGIAYKAVGAARYLARAIVDDPDWDVDEESLTKYWPVTANGIAASLRLAWKEEVSKWG
jgi:hypothetical protein